MDAVPEMSTQSVNTASYDDFIYGTKGKYERLDTRKSCVGRCRFRNLINILGFRVEPSYKIVPGAVS